MQITIPSPADIRSARIAAGLTQAQAADMVYLGAPERWTEYESGTRNIGRARWALFLLRAGLITLRELAREVTSTERK